MKKANILIGAVMLVLLMGCHDETASSVKTHPSHSEKTAMQPISKNYNTDDPTKAFDEIKAELQLIPKKYSLDAAAKGGYMMIVKDKVTSNGQLLDQFISDSESQKPASLTIVLFSDKEGSKANPIITKVLYNGFKFYAMEDDSRVTNKTDYYAFQFKNLKVFEESQHKICVLVNDNKMDYAQYLKSIVSSQSKDAVEVHILCAYTN